MSERLYVKVGGQFKGPLSIGQLREWIRSGSFPKDAAVYRFYGNHFIPVDVAQLMGDRSRACSAPPALPLPSPDAPGNPFQARSSSGAPSSPQGQPAGVRSQEWLTRQRGGRTVPESPSSTPPPLPYGRTGLARAAWWRELRVNAKFALVALACCILVLLVGGILFITRSRAPSAVPRLATGIPAEGGAPPQETAPLPSNPAGSLPPGEYLRQAEGATAAEAGTTSPEAKPYTARRPLSEPELPAKRTSAEPWVAQVRQACVLVQTYGPEGRGEGSGFFVTAAANKPIVVTNHHVVKDASDVLVKLHTGALHRVTSGHLFPECDLAFLAVDELRSPPAVLDLRTDLPELTETVYAYGAPMRLEATITKGIVSAIRRTSEVEVLAGHAELTWIQTDAAINPGNSGGPLIDVNGMVVGVNTLRLFPKETESMYFAISSVEISKRLSALRMARLPQRRIPLPQPDVSEAARILVATYTYWSLLATTSSAVGNLAADMNRKLSGGPVFGEDPVAVIRQYANDLRGAALFIQSLDTTGVDPTARDAGILLAGFYNEAGDFVDQSLLVHLTSPDRQIALQRAAILTEQFAQRHALVFEALARARVTLSARWGVDFAPLGP